MMDMPGLSRCCHTMAAPSALVAYPVHFTI
ncbi:hypothetical protein ATCC53582_02640 [Novacetimonas hansenii]|nr:hypothetical protein ATCC53582_02640 [Novacetimonas hansenii]